MAESATPSAHARGFSRLIGRAFPTPELLVPRSAGIDISDASIKWLELTREHGKLRVAACGEEPLKPGIVEEGTIKNIDALAAALSAVRARLGSVSYAHAALPEEAAYVFEMHVPEGNSHDQVMRLIEFEFEGRVPIAPNQAVFDYDVTGHDAEGQGIGISVFPRELAEAYATAFDRAGFTLVSLEVEARSIARATVDPNDPAIILLVDFGRARSGFAVLKRGIPIFTSTVEVGGDTITKALMSQLGASVEEAIEFRNEQGLAPEGGAKSPGIDAVVPTAAALADEVARHYHYWDTRRDERGERMTPVSRVILVGGSANLRGLTDYIASRVQAPALLGDVWRHIYESRQDIPPIERRSSLQYATAIGLALRAHL